MSISNYKHQIFKCQRFGCVQKSSGPRKIACLINHAPLEKLQFEYSLFSDMPTYPNTCWWSSTASNSRPYPTWWISLAISPRQAPPVLLMRLASQTPDGYWDDLQTDQISMLFFGASAPFPWPFLWQSSDWPNFWVFLSWIPTKFWVSLHSPNCYTDGRVLAP